ncbi:hypothetical protein HJG60_009109 [Phyllostomus discolor]|uniref:Uncharacterized protein n=1 Tax=Phyllostomus discolor TaxID=89673 RepID=A0A834DH89_9CHIR|nr:hypothetical protein HJG60_009109 [Phyllostomus discolor]
MLSPVLLPSRPSDCPARRTPSASLCGCHVVRNPGEVTAESTRVNLQASRLPRLTEASGNCSSGVQLKYKVTGDDPETPSRPCQSPDPQTPGDTARTPAARLRVPRRTATGSQHRAHASGDARFFHSFSEHQRAAKHQA